MENEFVTYPLALRLKSLGFDELCIAYWDDEKVFDLNNEYLKGSQMDSTWLTAPTWQSAFKWFRENHGLHHFIDIHFRTNCCISQVWKGRECFYNDHTIEIYEEAQEACLIKLCEIVESKKD